MATRKGINRNPYVINETSANGIIEAVMSFLCVFLPKTMAKRIICTVLLSAGLPVNRIALCTGLTERCIRDIGRSIQSGKISDVLSPRKGSGRKAKTAEVEQQIIEEVCNNNYHTLRQIADMIKEKFKMMISLPTVSKLLKKTASED